MSHGEHEATSLPGVDRRLWGKHRGLPAPYPVICHLIDTAALAGALWDEWMDGLAVLRAGAGSGRSGADFRKLVCFWAGLHDLGKVSPSFQVMVDELYGELIDQVPEYGGEGNDPVRRLRHNEVTQWALVKILRELGYPAGARARQDVGHQIAQLLGGHHGRFCAALTGAELRNPLRDGLGEGAWEQQRRVHAEVLRELTEAYEPLGERLSAAEAVVVAGIVIVADWLGESRGVHPCPASVGGVGGLAGCAARALGACGC